jgi:hypothetical protein
MSTMFIAREVLMPPVLRSRDNGADGAETGEAAEAGVEAAKGMVEKSQTIACLTQLPQDGWTSSHLIRRCLHFAQPDRDFVCVLRGGIVSAYRVVSRRIGIV